MDGKTLKEARQAKNWTQKDAAQALGITQAYLSMLETARLSNFLIFHRRLCRCSP